MDLVKLFAERFPTSGKPAIYRAPGRVNLIGEHTDYNLGFVLPIAIDFATWVAVSPNDSGRLRIRSENMNEMREWAVADIPGLRPAHDWTDYVIGVARQIPNLAALDLLIYSTVPVGAGLSSSAALEVSVGAGAGHRGARHRAGQTGSPQRERLCRKPVRHHGSIRLRLRARGLCDQNRLPQPGSRDGEPARWRFHRCGQHHGEARAQRVGLSRPRARMRGSRGGYSSRREPRSAQSARCQPRPTRPDLRSGGEEASHDT